MGNIMEAGCRILEILMAGYGMKMLWWCPFPQVGVG